MKIIRIAAYSVMYIPTLLLLYLVYYTLIFLPPSSPLPLVESDEVQGAGVPTLTWAFVVDRYWYGSCR